jgi:predicted RNA-binding protein with PIN domain
MAYLIDGHNLIPRLPGISLQQVDDEARLVKRLAAYARARRRDVEVFFDNAPPTLQGSRRHGRVTAHFVRQGSTADDAIRQRLKSLGGAAHNWTVVSTDKQVQAAARSAGAQVVSAEEFARQMDIPDKSGPKPDSVEKGAPPDEDIGEWLRLFGEEDDSERG